MLAFYVLKAIAEAMVSGSLSLSLSLFNLLLHTVILDFARASDCDENGCEASVQLLQSKLDVALRDALDAAVPKQRLQLAYFVAGIEGTGHHMIGDAFCECVTSGLCAANRTLLVAMKSGSLPFLSEAWQSVREYTEKPLVLNTACEGDELSYPYGRPMIMPDLDMYAEVARTRGENLKVLVLLREPAEIMRSDYERFHRDESEEIEATKVLVQHLEGLHPSSYFCLSYDSVYHDSKGLNNFLQVDFDMESTLRAVYNTSQGSQTTKTWVDKSRGLQGEFQALYQLCAGASQ